MRGGRDKYLFPWPLASGLDGFPGQAEASRSTLPHGAFPALLLASARLTCTPNQGHDVPVLTPSSTSGLTRNNAPHPSNSCLDMQRHP